MTTAIPTDAPPTTVKGGQLFANEPVRVLTAMMAFVQTVIAVLLLAEVVSEKWGGIIVGIATAAYAFANETLVRSNVVPLEPLEKLAYAARQQAATTPSPDVSGTPNLPT